MHICFLNMPIEFYSPVSGGAVSTVTANYARELLARGHKVSVLTITDDNPIYQTGEVVPIEAARREDLSFPQRALSRVRGKMHGWDYPYYEYYLRSFGRALSTLAPAPDAVIIHNDLVSPRYIKKILPSAKVIVWLHNENRTRRKSLAATQKSTHRFVAVSNYIRDWTQREYSFSDAQMAVLLSGVDLEIFTPRANFLEPCKPLRVLFIGRTEPNKGPDLMADAVEILKTEEREIEITVAGKPWFYGHDDALSDPYYRALHDKVLALGGVMAGLVARPDVPKLIREHDVVCVLSRKADPCPLVIFEAMASGCAVVASRCGGIPQQCEGAALLVEPGDLKTTTEALRVLCDDAAELRARKEKSVARAAQMSWSRHVDELEKLLHTAL